MKHSLSPFALVFCLYALSVFPTSAFAEKADKMEGLSDFMRVTQPEGRRQPLSMDTAIVHFVDAKKEVAVDLIAAVHIGDKEYYEELNEIFKGYDAVLYELVAEEGTVLDKETIANRKERSILSSFQSGMGEALALDFQLHHVDYTAGNFVHADLSPAEFSRRVSERGDLLQMLYRAIILSAKKSQEGGDEELKMQGRLLGTLFAADPSLALKRFFAKEMINQMDDSVFIIGGDGSAIITDRNNAALKVLRRELDGGKKKLAIFYGGAHLPEFVKSLEKDFKLTLDEVTWVIAWDLTKDRSARKKD